MAGLKTGMIDGAALDVFEEEPLTEDYPLLELENVWLSPHTAGSTQDAVYNGARVVVEDIAVLVGGGQPDHRIE